MKKYKIIQANKDVYIPHTFGKFTINKGDIIHIKIRSVKNEKI